jgi:oligoribonuclease
MTGLDVDRGDQLLEIACIVTDGELNALDAGVSYVIRTAPDVLANMNAWYVF